MESDQITIVLLHSVLRPITEDEARDAITARGRQGTLLFVSVELPWSTDPDWQGLRTVQERLFVELIQPRMRLHPDASVAYFGAAPVQLAMHLGFLVSTWTKVDVYQHHHAEKHWRWRTEERTEISTRRDNVPTDRNETTGDVRLRVSVSFPVLSEDANSVAPAAIADAAISSDQLELDAIQSPADLEAVATDVMGVVHDILAHRPGAERIHIFLAGPVGLAFRIGTMLNPTVVPPIATYQYHRSREPKYEWSFDVNGTETTPALSHDLEDLANRVRAAWKFALDELTKWVRTRSGSGAPKNRRWLGAIGLDRVSDRDLPLSLQSLPALGVGKFKSSKVSDIREVTDSFRFDQDRNQWDLDDRLLAAIGRRLDPTDWPRAARLFFLHECLHQEGQALTEDTAYQIGQRHPFLAEDFDYRADVWALLHELKFSMDIDESVHTTQWLRDGIEINAEIIWAFVPEHEARRRIELRRLRRFTIWYWLHAALRKCKDGLEAVRLLLDKPVVSLSGPVVHSVRGRTFLLLDRPFEVDPEAAVLMKNRLRRVGESGAVPLREAFEGLRGRDPKPMQRALRGFFDSTEDGG